MNENMKKLDLSGIWKLWMDEDNTGAEPQSFPMEMPLPSTTSCEGLGKPNPERSAGYLTDPFRFEGKAWFERSFTVPEEMKGLSAYLTLERTRISRVWLDGKAMGERNSLCTAHVYALGELEPGSHTLRLCVANNGYPTRGGHMTSPDTQSNWNGVTGEMSIVFCKTFFRQIQFFPYPENNALRIKALLEGPQSGEAQLTVDETESWSAPFENGLLETEHTFSRPMENWNEFRPALHQLKIAVGDDCVERSFGMRRFSTRGRELLLNGQPVFLRGKHDGLIHPLTGYAPTDEESWMRILGRAKEYGINHYRFHTCCPPEAAFAAADRLGICMEPELPFWGTITEEGDEGHNAAEREYLIEEGFRILAAFGHHPSFMMLSLGNELWGSEKAMNEMLRGYRAFDPDKLYTSGSNNFQFVPRVLEEEDVFVGVRLSRDRLFRGSYAMCDAPQGIVQTTEPESLRDYDEMIVPASLSGRGAEEGKRLIQYGTGVKEVEGGKAEELIPEVPVISHEVGQYEFYPDFDEMSRYTGPLKPRNFEIFRERLENAGLFRDWKRFFRSAGKLAVDCYRREIETALRSKELSGFQLLDLQDFSGQGTALVGVLNAFMESKGLIAPEAWQQFCGPVNVLAKFERFVFSAGQEIAFEVVISETRPGVKHENVRCTLLMDDEVLQTALLPVNAENGRLLPCGLCRFAPVKVDKPAKLKVLLETEYECENTYDLWVLAEEEVLISEEGITLSEGHVAFAASVEEAKKHTGPVIVVPDGEGKLPAEYCSDFWCYPMFRSISESMNRPVPVGTLGLCIRSEAPELSGFPTDTYTTPVWYRILKTAHLEEVDGDSEPIVEMIDNVERCKRFGLLYHKEGYLHLTAKLWQAAEDAEVKTFAASLARCLFQNRPINRAGE